ncbi:MAG: hypothetical protein CMN74_02375 [Sphingorhabdus sp.]|nr:hypothetical protein [Sphingorhabdus sp.]|tara:strand:- start:6436 stop:7017 length:582 start_codon:yes stop_codon:yes gene_type:complete
MKSIVFRCKSMTTDDFHHIQVPQTGHVMCTCRGESWCSHIEATLVAGERAMVPEEDRIKADKAQVLAKGRIGPPEDWKSNWRGNRRWRGIGIREPKAMTLLRSGVPVVSLQGKGLVRRMSARIAQQNGWSIVPAPTKGVIIHVSDEGDGDPKRDHALSLGITVLTHEQWPSIAPMGHTLKERMSDLLNEGNPS